MALTNQSPAGVCGAKPEILVKEHSFGKDEGSARLGPSPHNRRLALLGPWEMAFQSLLKQHLPGPVNATDPSPQGQPQALC